MDDHRIICIIPARYGSTRLPGKPLIEVGGLPLVMWVHNRAVASGAFWRVCVATDDPRIRDAVRSHGGTAVMTSPDHASGTDRVCEVARNEECGYVVNLQGDEPEIPPDLLRDFAGHLLALDNNSLLTCVTNATITERDDPDTVKVVMNVNNEALYFSRAPIPFDRGATAGPVLKHTGIYGFSREGLVRFCSLPRGELERREGLEQLRALEHGMRIKCLVRDYEARGIDSPHDLDEFRRRIEGRRTA